MSEDRLLSTREVAEILAITLSWVHEATRDGRLPHIALDRYRRYRRDEIEVFLEHARSGGARRL